MFPTRQNTLYCFSKTHKYIKVRCPYIEGVEVGGLSGMRAPPRGLGDAMVT